MSIKVKKTKKQTVSASKSIKNSNTLMQQILLLLLSMHLVIVQNLVIFLHGSPLQI